MMAPNVIKMIALATLLISVNTAPINSTITDYSYCNDTGSGPSPDMLQILYDDLDNALDVLGEVCLDNEQIVRCHL